jgi:hypothetical protein
MKIGSVLLNHQFEQVVHLVAHKEEGCFDFLSSQGWSEWLAGSQREIVSPQSHEGHEARQLGWLGTLNS